MDNRKNILKCLGDFPKKVNLETKELNSEDMGDHIRKLIEYTVEKCNEKIEKTIGNNSNFKLIRFNDDHKFNDTEKEEVYKFLNDNL